MAVCVGLPLTTKAPLTAAPALAAAKPRMSAFSSTRSLKIVAYTREVAALCAMIMTKHDAATGTRSRDSRQLTSGHLSDGRPPGTGPMTAKPCSDR